MALRKGLPAKEAATDADDTRYDFSGLIVCNADGSPRGGVLSPVGVNLVTATGTMNVSVARFQGVAVRDAGVVLLANDGPTNVLLDAAPAANSRIDVIWAKQNDASSTVTSPDSDDLPVFGVSKGTAGAVPVKPSVPDGALELATVQIPSTATATNSPGVVITQSAQFTAGAGGVVPFRTAAAMYAVTTLPEGTRAWVLSSDADFVRTAGGWKSLTPSAFVRPATAFASSGIPAALPVGTTVSTDEAFTHSDGVFTCVVPGTYRVSAGVSFPGNASGVRTAKLVHSVLGARTDQKSNNGVNEVFISLSWVAAFAVGNTLTLQAQQNSGGNLNVSADVVIEAV